MKKKRIGIDARMWAHPGIGRYLRELCRALLRVASADRFVFFGEEALLRPVLGADAVVTRASAPIYSLAEQWEAASLSREVDVWHAPHFNVPFFGPRALVCTLHDLIYLRDRASLKNPLGRTYVRAMVARALKRAAAVVTVSEASRSDILDLFPKTDPKKITVVHEAASDLFCPQDPGPAGRALLARYGLDRPFALFVGSLKPHKNVSALTAAIRALRDVDGLDVQAVLVGRADAKHPEILRDAQGAGPSVRYLGELPDEHLALLYNAATTLVLPSFFEGFGLPALEAMACGTPVILSRRASLPEIGGDAALYFEPERVDALKELLYTIFKNQDLRQKMSARCLAQASKFTWENTARRTLAVYDKVLA